MKFFIDTTNLAMFHQCIKKLHDYGYISYNPYLNATVRSQVHFLV